LKPSSPTATTYIADEVELSDNDGGMEGEKIMVEITVIMSLSDKTDERPRVLQIIRKRFLYREGLTKVFAIGYRGKRRHITAGSLWGCLHDHSLFVNISSTGALYAGPQPIPNFTTAPTPTPSSYSGYVSQ
jgi:hypothetical protein